MVEIAVVRSAGLTINSEDRTNKISWKIEYGAQKKESKQRWLHRFLFWAVSRIWNSQ